MNGSQLMTTKLPFSLLPQNESICQLQSISYSRAGTPYSAPASYIYLKSVYEKRSCIPVWKENKKAPQRQAALQGDEAKIALTVKKELSTLG